MYKKITILIISCIVFQFSRSQDRLRFDILAESGIEFRQNTQLNDYLKSIDCLKIENQSMADFISIGFRIRTSSNSFINELLFSKSHSNDLNSSRISLYRLQLNFLYNLIKSSNWIIAPKISFSLTDVYLDVLSQNLTTSTGKPSLDGTYRALDVFGVGIGPDFEYRFHVLNIDMITGVSICYNVDFGSRLWKDKSNTNNSNLPSINRNSLGLIFKIVVPLSN